MALTTMQRVAKCAADTALRGVRVRDGIHYTQQAKARWTGVAEKILGPNQPPAADCSSYTTWAIWQARVRVRGGAGIDVINGENWRAGYTGTQVLHGKRHRGGVRWYKRGRTLIFYAGKSGEIEHVAMYVGGGMVVSHGSEQGPLYLPYNYRTIVEARCYRI